MRIRVTGGCIAGALILLSTSSMSATAAGPTLRARPMVRPFAARPVRTIYGRHVSGPNCTANSPSSFIGIPGVGNVAGSYASSVTSGTSNLVCEPSSGIVAGSGNVIQTDTDTTFGNSFIGAGQNNTTDALNAFVGAGSNNSVTGADAFVGAGVGNEAEAEGSFIGAGGTIESAHNVTTAQDSFIGAGDGNSVAGLTGFIGAGVNNTVTASASYSSVVGGSGNAVSGEYAAILGGASNTVTGEYSSITGGNLNKATGEYSDIVGGYGNVASGAYAVVIGGDANHATGTLSLAGGYHATAAHNGSFVWSDFVSGSTVVADTAPNQFVVRASGGVTLYSNEAATSGVQLTAGSGTWASLSDRNAKTGIVPLDDGSVLAKLSTLPISDWSYRSEPGVRHVGPMAQDFYAAFGVGADDRHITSIDEDGVALSGIKALAADLRAKDAIYRSNRSEIAALRQEMRKVESALASSATK